jgi:hypothetical protein
LASLTFQLYQVKHQTENQHLKEEIAEMIDALWYSALLPAPMEMPSSSLPRGYPPLRCATDQHQKQPQDLKIGIS